MDSADIKILSPSSGYGILSSLRSWQIRSGGNTLIIGPLNKDGTTASPETQRGLQCSDPNAPIA